MNNNLNKLVSIILPVILAIVAIIAVGLWLQYDPTQYFEIYTPNLKQVKGPAVAAVKIGQYFERFTNLVNKSSGSWARFRGDNFDNISSQALNGNPNISNLIWSVDLGEGHAGAAISDGRVYVLDYDEAKKADTLRCFDLKAGLELWRRWYHVKIKRNHGISRTVPAVNDKYVLTIGPKCHVMCVDKQSGDFRWGIDLVAKYGSKVPGWYTGQCPLIDADIAVIAPAGTNIMMLGVDCKTGQIAWQTTNVWGWNMSHSSIMPIELFGEKMYLYSAAGGILAVAAEGAQRGQVLWATNAWNHSVVAPAPLAIGDNKIFLTAGYGAGSMIIQIQKSNKKFEVVVLDQFSPKEGFASEQQTPIFFNNKIYGILPKDAGEFKNQLVCLDPSDLKKYLWTSGKINRFGLGPYIVVNDKLFVLSDDGWLSLVNLKAESFQQISKIKVLDGHDAWGPIALADGYMLLRDSKTMICIGLDQ